MTLYLGMDTTTGSVITDTRHLQQSIADILFTPLGSRVQRRDYGSNLPGLIDRPFNSVTRMQVQVAVVTALRQWEPRISLSKVDILDGDQPGRFLITLTGIVNVDGMDRAATLVIPGGNTRLPVDCLLVSLGGDYLLANGFAYLSVAA
jgi:phage baseplate assembly protein W